MPIFTFLSRVHCQAPTQHFHSRIHQLCTLDCPPIVFIWCCPDSGSLLISIGPYPANTKCLLGTVHVQLYSSIQLYVVVDIGLNLEVTDTIIVDVERCPNNSTTPLYDHDRWGEMKQWCSVWSPVLMLSCSSCCCCAPVMTNCPTKFC